MQTGRTVETSWGALALAAAAVAVGCSLLVALGAPARMPLVNAAALVVGLATVGMVAMVGRAGATAWVGDFVLLAASAVLPLTALVGPEANGVARWLIIGGFTLQPAMIIVPVLALGIALRPSAVRTVAACIAALGLALQPDPGGAAMLLLGLATPALMRARHRATDLAGPIAAAVALAVAQARAPALPPVPFVEQVIPDALSAGPLAAALALAAALMMMAPGLARPLRATHLAFLGVWVAALAMALLGPYPTPVIGFGASGVLGYVLAAGLLALETGALRRR